MADNMKIAPPDRIACPQDVEDIYKYFEREANEYVYARLPLAENERMVSTPRVFHSPWDKRWVTDENVEQFARLMGATIEVAGETGMVNWVLSVLTDYMNTVAEVRKVVGLKEDKKHGTYLVVSRVKALYHAHERVSKAIEEAIKGLLARQDGK